MSSPTSTSGPRGVLFDLDGTLVDSIPDLAEAVNDMLAELGRDPRPEATVAHWVGNGIEALVRRALTDGRDEVEDRSLLEFALQRFRAAYAKRNGTRSRPFPGVRTLLAACRAQGLSVGLVTNKAAAFTAPLLERLELAEYFDVVVSGDTTSRKKPDPEPLFFALSALELRPEEAVMVGDSVHDIAAGRNAGMAKVCAVTYGYNHGKPIEVGSVDALVDEFEALREPLGLSPAAV